MQDNVSVALDVDGVLAGFTQAMVQRAQAMGLPFYDHYTEWVGWIDADTERGTTFDKVWETLDDTFWLNDVQPLAKAHVPFQVDAYVTARASVSNGITELWLSKHGFPAAPVHKVDCREDKEPVLAALGVDYFVDDNSETVQMLQGSEEYDGRAILMDTPHNHLEPVSPRLYYLSDLPRLVYDYERSAIE